MRLGSRGRRFLAPEVIQTSNVDCGPAALKCLLEGFGLPASYGRLREACQTDVDGTSIDTVEEVGSQLGLLTEQVLLPPDHLEMPGTGFLPAVIVVRNPSGETHFVVVWRRHGRWLQVMDPATGRRWMSTRRFLRQVYVHAMEVDAEDWHGWARQPESLAVLSRQLEAVGCRKRDAEELITGAVEDWRALATLEAASRMTRQLITAGGLRPGRDAARLLAATYATAREDPATGGELLARPFWSAVPAGDGGRVLVHGAVLVRALGRRAEAGTGRSRAAPPPAEPRQDEVPPAGPDGDGSAPGPLSEDLATAVRRPEPGTARRLLDVLREDGAGRLWLLAAASIVAAAGLAVEALTLRSFLELGDLVGVARQRLEAFAALAVLLAGLAGLEIPSALLSLRAGRHLEIRLRRAFLHKLPRLGDRFFSSRPVSDMSERSHAVHALRNLPYLGGRLLQTLADLLFTTAGIVWLDPAAWPLALALALAAVGVPLLNHRLLAERELRVRTHRGALGRFYLDVLLGAAPVRAHGAERAVRRSHEGLLTELARGSSDLLRATVAGLGVQSLAVHALAVWLIVAHVGRAGTAGAVLLLVYWVMKIPAVGQQAAFLARQYPPLRNAAQRLLEPLGALEETSSEAEPLESPRLASRPPADAGPGVALSFEGATVRVSGHTLLEDVHWNVPAGAHVAIVGSSGAGKSTLLGLLLGWHRSALGRVLVDGEPLTGDVRRRLLHHTAWVDPAVQLWNRSLHANLRYGVEDGTASAIGAVLAEAELRPVVEKLPAGLRTPLGEGGRRLSGGEGQRVRLGRGLLRPSVRLALLDEPFRGLDREARRRLLDQARSRWRRATLLCVTHDVEDSLGFDRVLVIDGGRIVEDGPPEELRARPDSSYRRMLDARREIRRDLLHGPGWRRMRLADGRIVEIGPAGHAPLGEGGTR